MASIADQINELLGILDIVDPAAAAAIRNGPPNRFPSYAGAKDSIQAVPAVAPSMPSIESAAASEPATRLSLTPDSLIQGIIFSEILGKPLARRRGHGRP
jgi:hypothetical protein